MLDWAQPDAGECKGPVSFVLGADLVYTVEAVQHLATALKAVLEGSPDCRLLLSHCSRHSSVDEALFAALAALGLRVAAVADSAKDMRVMVYICSR